MQNNESDSKLEIALKIKTLLNQLNELRIKQASMIKKRTKLRRLKTKTHRTEPPTA